MDDKNEPNVMDRYRNILNTATELYRDDSELQKEISESRQCLEKFPNLTEAIIKTMSWKMDNIEKDLVKKQKEQKDASKEDGMCSSQPLDR